MTLRAGDLVVDHEHACTPVGLDDGADLASKIDLLVRKKRRRRCAGHPQIHERVAIVRTAYKLAQGEQSDRAGLVLHDDRLAERGAEMLRHDARDDVRRRSGAIGNQQQDGLLGPKRRLRMRHGHNAGQERSEEVSQQVI